ncbi:lipoyl(octanoyl) transferase LipB [Desulfomonile tiedjei]|nr:lipoyl(octanoyl) transferase LipB [Desulfomonile tiedjei]
MAELRDLRLADGIPDVLLFLSHPKTISVGLKDKASSHPKDLLVPMERLDKEGIAFVRSVRGGGITYHWTGQLVCYPVMKLGSRERDIPAYMNRLERVGMETLQHFGLSVRRRRDSAAHVGLWLGNKKIVSMGVRVSRWVTSFGFAINLEGDFSPASYVRPCGLEGVQLTTLEESLGFAPSRETVMNQISEKFASIFQRESTNNTQVLRERIASITEHLGKMGDGAYGQRAVDSSNGSGRECRSKSY